MIRVSYRRDGDRWVGVLKAGRHTIVECGHTHTNRDMTTSVGEAAQVCARMILAGARNQHTAESRADQYRTAYLRLINGTGFVLPTGMIEQAKADGIRNADAYLTLVDQVRQRPDLDAIPAPTTPPAPEPVDLGELPDWMTT